ncbi:MAG TPA: hypothetical protein VN688_32505 [Gemmataceae bacterium]|nr:hypothetical protein [Gemmataceae bacterium]
MSDQAYSWNRLGLIAALVERAAEQPLGRTALVKLAYLLQTFRRVPLGYDFRLYTYGPFDAEVLNDLAQAQSLQVVEVKIVSNAVGYGYDIRPGTNIEWLKRHVASWLAEHDEALNWVMSEFGHRSASELELIGTILYVDQENLKQSQRVSVENLIQRVREIKPHFAEEFVKSKVEELIEKRLLLGLEAAEDIPF